jgi:uncharacterized protein (DUF362 family)/Pyruvate/2-oxoacid:ferredoxin oxidoreductase delta subunit
VTPVSLIRCESYDQPELDQAVRRAVDLLGGISRFVKSGDRVLLKPNLLAARTPEKRVTTDPDVVRCVARMVMEAGGRPFIADSPAIESFRKVAQTTGMNRVAEELGIELKEMERSTPFTHGGNGLFRKLELSADALEADVVINLPKLKTHSQMLLTLGVKNLFGTVVAQRKAEWHYMVGVNRDTFASLLLEIYRNVNPALTILDGVWGMEGHGPSNGSPRHIKVIGASGDAVALDVSICRILGVVLSSFPLYRAARETGTGETDLKRIDYFGDDPGGFVIKDFDAPRLDSVSVLPSVFDWFAKRYLASKPVQEKDTCAGCGQCAEICPAEAIQLGQRKIDFDYDRCIRCYCCQEVCPRDAIQFKKGLIMRLLNRLGR